LPVDRRVEASRQEPTREMTLHTDRLTLRMLRDDDLDGYA
jgi:hypothetical protein